MKKKCLFAFCRGFASAIAGGKSCGRFSDIARFKTPLREVALKNVLAIFLVAMSFSCKTTQGAAVSETPLRLQNAEGMALLCFDEESGDRSFTLSDVFSALDVQLSPKISGRIGRACVAVGAGKFLAVVEGKFPKSAEKMIFSSKNGFEKTDENFGGNAVYEWNGGLRVAFAENGVLAIGGRGEMPCIRDGDGENDFDIWSAGTRFSAMIPKSAFEFAGIGNLPVSALSSIFLRSDDGAIFDLSFNFENERAAALSAKVISAIFSAGRNVEVSASHCNVVVCGASFDFCLRPSA